MLDRKEAVRLLHVISELASAEVSERQENGETVVVVRLTDRSARAAGSKSHPNGEATERGGEERKLRVLHIEDTDRVGDLIYYYLRNTYEVETARNAEEALALAFRNSYDFVLMDMDLGPGMNGFELTRLLRKSKEYAELPIIAITGYTSKKDIQQSVEAGCNAYLSKPFLKEDLLKVLRELAPK